MQDRCEVITIFVFWNTLKAVENNTDSVLSIVLFITAVVFVLAVLGIIVWQIVDYIKERKR